MFPVEEKIGEIRAALVAGRDVVLTAPPGSGKTTCVPPALLDERWLGGRKIVMLEPRRIAARNCATYISRKLGEPVGGTVGYQVRLERKISAKTRLEVLTEGLLTQRLLSDPELADVGLVIFDEFHERSLQCDLAYALVREMKNAFRPDLRIIVMSATLDADEVFGSLAASASKLPPARVSASGRMFPVETKYLGDLSMTSAISKALAETDGDILCFLPGEGEIRRVQNALAESGQRSEVEGQRICVLPLYGSLPKEEQDRVFQPLQTITRINNQTIKQSNNQTIRKVVLATSIAETSVTIEGVTCVIDSGLMRVPRFSPATGMSGLVTLPLSQDRAEQRRGRAGRVRPGVCYRLWTEGQQQSRPKKMMPEILDADLCPLVLTSAAWGALGREDLPWMTPPPASAWDQSAGLLKMLGALDASGRLTPKGERMSKLPMHPRLANMVWQGFIVADSFMSVFTGRADLCVGRDRARPSLTDLNPGHRNNAEAQRRGEGMAACLAAILEEGTKSRETDIRKIYDEILETPNRPQSKRILQLSHRFSLQAFQTITRINNQTIKQSNNQTITRINNQTIKQSNNQTITEGGLLALAYPDRVAKNRGNGTFRMVGGRGAFLPEDDPLAKSPFLVCCELDDRAGDAKIFLGCPIGEDEILDLFGDRIVEEPFCEWDARNERVKAVVRRKLGEMTLREVESRDGGGEGTVRALLDGVRQKGVENLPCWTKETLQLRARINFLNRTFHCSPSPSASASSPPWPQVSDETILSALGGFVGGMTKWRDLEKLDLAAVMDFILMEAGHDRRELDRLAPTRMEVPSGSHMLIRYEGDEPTVEVRLQECFGLMETPKVAGGRVPIVMTLLSPAQRPIQITKDLAGFWKGAYQLVRKDMRGRYPKHYWPEDPFTAVATRRTTRRPSRENTPLRSHQNF